MLLHELSLKFPSNQRGFLWGFSMLACAYRIKGVCPWRKKEAQPATTLSKGIRHFVAHAILGHFPPTGFARNLGIAQPLPSGEGVGGGSSKNSMSEANTLLRQPL